MEVQKQVYGGNVISNGVGRMNFNVRRVKGSRGELLEISYIKGFVLNGTS